MLLTKNKKKQIEGVDFNKTYSVIEAVKLLKEKKFVKFDESIEVSINTGIDSKQSDQNVRGSFVPPHGCLLYTSPSPRDATLSRMPSSA